MNSRPPAEIKLCDQVFSIAFHPTKNIIAAGEISGKVTLSTYSEVENKTLFSFDHHKKACRALSFSLDGKRLYSCSRDKSIQVLCMDTGTRVHVIQKSHQKAVNCMEVFADNCIVSGSDDGVVKVWDTRTFATIAQFSEHQDYISDMTFSADRKILLCTSGDGVLSVYNLRKKKLEETSDQLDEELLSLAVVKNGQKVVCGSADGVLNLYSWGEWGDVSDRIPTQSDSVDSICAVTENIICTGGGDGVIRSLFVQPHSAIGVVGKHGSFGIENLKLSADQQLMASCSSENTVKFWDVSALHEQSPDNVAQKKKNKKRKHDEEASSSKDDFFSDL